MWIEAVMRGCLQSVGSSIFGIILAAFRLQITREISTIVYFPRNLNRKSAQKNPKIDRTLLCRHPLKSFAIFAAALGAGASLFGAPVGDPLFSRLLKEGYFIPDHSHVNFRLGYEGDFISDARMKQTVEGCGRIDDYRQDANSGTVTLNLFDRLDLFGVFGSARTCADWRYVYEDAVFRVQLETSYRFLWAAGGRAIIFEWGQTVFGLGGRYNATDANPVWAAINGVPISTKGTRLRWNEWQIDFDVAHQIEIFVPYIGVKYSSSHTKVGNFSEAPIAGNGSGTLHMRNRTPVGLVIGCTLTTEKYFMLNIEGRLIDELACTIAGDFRF
jgi:hypothetical protein